MPAQTALQQPLPSYITKEDKIILFDGVCRLCNGWAKFIIRYDHQHQFTLATVQSIEGQELLAHFGLPTEHYETMVLIEAHQLYTQSSAFIRVMAHLPWYWKPITIIAIIPKRLRNWLYDRIALNRYRLFGKQTTCLVPQSDHQRRFLNKNRTDTLK